MHGPKRPHRVPREALTPRETIGDVRKGAFVQVPTSKPWVNPAGVGELDYGSPLAHAAFDPYVLENWDASTDGRWTTDCDGGVETTQRGIIARHEPD
jgi:hypothetical protein